MSRGRLFSSWRFTRQDSASAPGTKTPYWLGQDGAGVEGNLPEKLFRDHYVITEVGAIRSGQGFMPMLKKGVHADMANYNSISKAEADRVISELDELIKSGRAEGIFAA